MDWPGGKYRWDMNPMAVQVKACVSSEKNAAVRPFWIATSKEKFVPSSSRKTPRTVPSLSMTATCTTAEAPIGWRMPARTLMEVATACRMTVLTSSSVSF